MTRGEVSDVAVDIRRSSPCLGQWVSASRSDNDHRMTWVPPGFAHGCVALSDEIDFQYKCTDFYAPQHERAIRWDDGQIGVRWPLPTGIAPTLSAKDAIAPLFKNAETFP
jgi:dTDP-4-dehydrorhamnose 3,5-epimerase